MTFVPDKIVHAAWRLVPAPIERKLRAEAGQRFSRFVLVAIVGVITSQVMLGLLTGPVNLSAGRGSGQAALTCSGRQCRSGLSRWRSGASSG
jgi:hypothetical protein